jgi:predicted alpha/beta hydrolase family esterase
VDRRFLILHGLTGSGGGHWQVWLDQRLRERGAWISFPELAEPDAPAPQVWEAQLAAELEDLARGAGERVVLAHSLGSILWLRHTTSIRPAHRPDRVALVAPPCGPSGIEEIAPFFPLELEPARVRAAAGATLLVCSDNDPYCPDGANVVYGATLGIASEVIPGGGHLNSDAGYGPWPQLEQWCLGRRLGLAR